MRSPALYRFAQFTVAATFALIFIGAMVTSKDAGLAVPDWPLSYGSLNPPGWIHIENVRLEHGHRLFASLVGILTTVLAVWIWKSRQPRSLKMLGLAAFIAVVFQGVLGGLRVTHLSTVLAIVHGCVAQAFLCLLITLAVLLAPTRSVTGLPQNAGVIRSTAWCMVAVVYCQLIVGAVMRHLHAGLAMPTFPWPLMPAAMTLPIAIHFAHRVGALIVAAVTITLLILVFLKAAGCRQIVRPTLGIVGLVSLQIALGAHIIWLARAPITTTLHVVNGAAILGLSLLLALRATHLGHPEIRTANVAVVPELTVV
jgi:cytochrome c oxidase assembly protein subunit 15